MTNSVLTGAMFFILLGAWLTGRQSYWSYYWNFAGLALFSFFTTKVGLVGLSVLVYVYFIPIQLYGAWYWYFKGEDGHDNLFPFSPSTDELSLVVMWIIFVTCVFTVFFYRVFPDVYPWGLSFLLVGSVTAQWLQCKKIIEAWIVWLLVDLSSATIFLLIRQPEITMYFTLHFLISILSIL